MKTLKYLVSFIVGMSGVTNTTQINIYNKLGRDSSVMTNANGWYHEAGGPITCNCGSIAAAAVGSVVIIGGAVLVQCSTVEATRWAQEQIPNQASSWGLCTVNELKLEVNDSGTCFKGRGANEYFYSIKVPGGAIWNVDLIPVSAVPAGVAIRRML